MAPTLNSMATSQDPQHWGCWQWTWSGQYCTCWDLRKSASREAPLPAMFPKERWRKQCLWTQKIILFPREFYITIHWTPGAPVSCPGLQPGSSPTWTGTFTPQGLAAQAVSRYPSSQARACYSLLTWRQGCVWSALCVCGEKLQVPHKTKMGKIAHALHHWMAGLSNCEDKSYLKGQNLLGWFSQGLYHQPMQTINPSHAERASTRWASSELNSLSSSNTWHLHLEPYINKSLTSR